jgi:hypothetical protein
METRLKFIREVEPRLIGRKKIKMAECLCECGNKVITRFQYYKSNHTKSCGCLKSFFISEVNVKHSHSSNNGVKKTSREYNSWGSMKNRCYNPKNNRWNSYGGRGIKVCDRWLNSFENFLEDMGERPNGCSIDRIDPNGNYEPNNCRWATSKEQGKNKRVHIQNLNNRYFILVWRNTK